MKNRAPQDKKNKSSVPQLPPEITSRTKLANAIRALSMDAVEKAQSGHPGMPMGMADIAEVLWNDYLQHNPKNPEWLNRDRFVLSNGHGSMLIYSILHLSGYDLGIEDIKNFRQLHSKTPGHPEYGETPGIETTTGPLGQGLANAVGMAIAEKTLSAQFNKPDYEIVDHNTYVFLGDGCLMEGISHEACSLAGTLKLNKLIAFYDDNKISIDGPVQGWFTDDTEKRFKSYGWNVIPNVDGHNPDHIKKAIDLALKEKSRPTLICCHTVIGLGAPNKQGTEDTHGAPLGNEEIELARKSLTWSHGPFEIPDEIYAAWNAVHKGKELQEKWDKLFARYKQDFPKEAQEFLRRNAGDLPNDWEKLTEQWLEFFDKEGLTIATRVASLNCLNQMAPTHLPELVGGSADLTGSNLTAHKTSKGLQLHKDGNYIFYGVREFAMSAIMNGITLHGGYIPYSGTFLTFSDYSRNALRMAALMKIRSIFIFTHDSIGLGEDGPTHQAIEHLSSLRLIPNMSVWRPSDNVETMASWVAAIERNNGPTCLILSRQSMPHQKRTADQIKDIKRGGYILKDSASNPDLILIATGSEVGITMEAAATLETEGVACRVVSMPSTDVFEKQNLDYQNSVLPPKIDKRIVIESGVSNYWHKYVGGRGRIIGINEFGASAPGKELMEFFGFTAERICEDARNLISEKE